MKNPAIFATIDFKTDSFATALKFLNSDSKSFLISFFWLVSYYSPFAEDILRFTIVIISNLAALSWVFVDFDKEDEKTYPKSDKNPGSSTLIF